MGEGEGWGAQGCRAGAEHPRLRARWAVPSRGQAPPASTQESCELLAVPPAACVGGGWNEPQVLPFHLACSEEEALMEQTLPQQPNAWEPRGLAGGVGVLGHSFPLRLKPESSSCRMVAVLSLAKAACPRDTEGSLTWGVWAQSWGR